MLVGDFTSFQRQTTLSDSPKARAFDIYELFATDSLSRFFSQEDEKEAKRILQHQVRSHYEAVAEQGINLAVDWGHLDSLLKLNEVD
jgi:hypothetical protein